MGYTRSFSICFSLGTTGVPFNFLKRFEVNYFGFSSLFFSIEFSCGVTMNSAGSIAFPVANSRGISDCIEFRIYPVTLE
jgi:hypothetical protein